MPTAAIGSTGEKGTGGRLSVPLFEAMSDGPDFKFLVSRHGQLTLAQKEVALARCCAVDLPSAVHPHSPISQNPYAHVGAVALRQYESHA